MFDLIMSGSEKRSPREKLKEYSPSTLNFHDVFLAVSSELSEIKSVATKLLAEASPAKPTIWVTMAPAPILSMSRRVIPEDAFLLFIEKRMT